jgi:DNA-binding NarL/FixJ family response regulator
MNFKFLLIYTAPDQRLEDNVFNAATKLGYFLEICSLDEISSWSRWNDYELVIVDATSISDLPELISFIKARTPASWIIVLSPAPSHTDVKGPIDSGAGDYDLKYSTKEDILRVIERNLARKKQDNQDLRRNGVE